jgi:hypothetical protein
MENEYIHHYHHKTKLYVSSTELELDPIANTPLLPAHSTQVEPPEAQANQVARWTGSAWELIADYRGYQAYDAQGVLHSIEEVAIEPNPEWTLERPFILSEAQQTKLNELTNLCEITITSGFSSAALGSTHTYQSERDDQLNLSGVASSGSDWPFKCSPDDGQTWEYKQHTAVQLKQVVDDGIQHKLTQLTKLQNLKQLVNDLPSESTQEDIDQITW